MMFLEAQFGADNVAPIAEPKLPDPLPSPPQGATTQPKKPKKKPTTTVKDEDSVNGGASMDGSSEDEEEDDDDEKSRARRLQQQQEAELARLHALGIPVPGVRIKVDKMEARVWLEQLEVECGNRVFADRVRAVVERAVEVTAPLWG
jgi:cleavage and polyadenylation specificity factor subunit 3